MNSYNLEYESDPVTYGSVVKMENNYYHSRLHSHNINYGSGSGHQSVTGVESADDVNSYWVLLSDKSNETQRNPIKCNSVIRFKHLATGNYLWSSELYNSPLTSNQEVSAYNPQHGDALSGQVFNRPIHNQKEVCGVASKNSKSCQWQLKEGMYYKPNMPDFMDVTQNKDEL